MTVGLLIERLLAEFPTWSNEQAYEAATQITAYAARLRFQLEVERDLDALPLTTDGVA